jgi:tyrosyl-tRNA synthetase
MGGSDQWGNLISGVELIRRMEGGEVYAVTSPLVTKSDGTKFGKTEKGNVFLSADMTSPYSFYQFWLNVSDEDAEKFIKIFTFLDRPTIEALIEEHRQDPSRRVLQKRLAEEVTVMVHSQEDLETAIKASSILFGKGTKETLQSLSLRDLLSVFEGVPQFNIEKAQLTDSISVIDFLTNITGVFASKSDVRRAIKGNALTINSEKITNDTETISSADLINNSLVWVQNGKKNNYLVLVG